MLEKIKKISLNFLNKYFMNCHGALLTGSYATNEYEQDSDIDLMIFSQVSNRQFIENFDFEGYEIQAIVLPFHRIHELLQKDYDRREGIYIHMIQSAILIKGSPVFVESLKDVANFLALKGPKNNSNESYKNIRYHITSRLLDLSSYKTFNEAIFIGLEIIQESTRLNLMSTNQWSGSKGKHLARFLKKSDELYYNELCSAFEEFIKTKSSQKFINTVKRNLQAHGGVLHHITTHETLTEVKDDKLVLRIGSNNGFDDIRKILEIAVLPLIELINKYTDKCYTYKTDENSYANQSIYIVANSSKEEINDNILEIIRQFVLNNKELRVHGVYVVFPIEYYPYIGFGDESTICLVEDVFTAVSGDFLKNVISYDNEASKIISSLNMLISFGISLEVEKSKYKILLDKLTSLWLPRAYDQAGVLNHDQLEYKKYETLTEFENSYNEHKNLFPEYIISSFDTWSLVKSIEMEEDFATIFTQFNSELTVCLVQSELFAPNYFSNLQQLTLAEQKLFSYYVAIINRLMECCFINDKEKAYVVYVSNKLLDLTQ